MKIKCPLCTSEREIKEPDDFIEHWRKCFGLEPSQLDINYSILLFKIHEKIVEYESRSGKDLPFKDYDDTRIQMLKSLLE